MKVFKDSFNVWFAAAFLVAFQFNSSFQEDVMGLQNKVEHLIESVLKTVHNFYSQLRAEHKCIPDEVPDKIMETLKNSIDCMDAKERQHPSGRTSRRMQQKNFLKCFLEAKKEVRAIMSEIDVNRDYCPENATEKTYQINVTTSYTKRFKISIKNGLEVSKVIDSNGTDRHLCLESDEDTYEQRDHEESEGHEEQYMEYYEDEGNFYLVNPETGRSVVETTHSEAHENEEARHYHDDYHQDKDSSKTSGSSFVKTFKPPKSNGPKTGSKESGPKPRLEEKVSALSLEIPLSSISS